MELGYRPRLDPRKFDPSKHMRAEDKQFLLVKPDKGFSVAHNMKVIRDTINKHNWIVASNMKTFEEKIQERAHAIVSYWHSKALVSGKNIAKYLGKRELAYLRGQDILHRAKMSQAKMWTPQGLVTLKPQ